jgi:molybdate transport repressor ModE-like protein
VGGKEGGGARLTSQGKEFLDQYSAFRKGLEGVVAKKFAAAFKK